MTGNDSRIDDDSRTDVDSTTGNDSTTDNDSDRKGVSAVLTDDRARVPFAIIAVLLLLSAVVLVGYLETRESPETDTDATLAMDRTEGAVQTTLRDAAASAAIQAGEQPLTDPANTSYGDALNEERPFLSYLEALVYLEANERFENTGQQVGAVETAVSLPEVTTADEFETAIDRVTITESEAGLLTVELEDIDIAATRDGEHIASRTETVEVSVPTPVRQQHERTQAFQERLDAGVTSMGSFSQRFNTRIYALGWLRGYAQYGGKPVTEVIANRHVQPSANSALYRTQQDVFGAADPTLGNAVRRGWFCMVAQDAEELYGGEIGGEADVAEDICEASEWIFGEKHTGELPDAPDVLDMLDEVPGMDEEHTIGVNETAYSPLRSLVSGSDEHSIEGAIERALTIEAGIDTELQGVDTPTFDHDPEEAWELIDTERIHVDLSVDDGSVIPGNPAEDGTYHQFSEVDVTIELIETNTWDVGGLQNQTTVANDTLDVTLSVELNEHETAPGLHVAAFNDVGVDHEYEAGPTTPSDERTVPEPFENYADSETRVTEAIVGGTSLGAFETWLGLQWENATHTDNLTLPTSRNATLELDPAEEAELVATALDDITILQESVENITHTFERTDLVHGADETSPVGELAGTVEDARDGYLDRGEPYESVGQQAVYEVRHAYFETLVEDLLLLDEAHGELMGGLDDQLDDVDSGLDDALSFLQQGLTGDEPSAQPIESPDITPEITYEVSGSPTYLAGEPVTTEDVPAVDQNEAFSPFAAKNSNYLKLPYEEIVGGIVDTLLDTLGLGSPDAELTLRTAGEALRAGELAEDAAAADEEYADGGELGEFNDELRDAIEGGLTEFTLEMGREVVRELYDADPVSVPPYYSNETHLNASAAVQNATVDAIADYGTTAETAIAIGGGNATEPLVANVTEALDDDELDRPAYAAALSSEDWQAVVASAVRPAVDRAAANATATVDSTELVEDLDTRVRQALENVSMDIIEDRLGAYVEDGTFDLSDYDEWVGDGDSVDTPVRVPAGLPILPVPSKWVATMNVWDVDADGTYARFEVEANMSAPGRATSTTYVRENTTVETEIGGETRTLGAVEPIEFDGRSLLVVVVPSGGVGVGDRDDENPECTETYPVVGPFDEDETACEFLGSDDPPDNSTDGTPDG